MAPSAPPSSSREQALLDHYLPTNPIPFAIALIVMGVVMLSFPKSAVAIGAIIVLGALVVDARTSGAVGSVSALKSLSAYESTKGTTP